MNEELHEMHLIQQHESGAEEWECPQCGRRFLLRLQPSFQKVILKVGDENAIHSGGTGGLSIMVSQPIQAEPEDLEEWTLEPWQRWLDSVDFESLWDREL